MYSTYTSMNDLVNEFPEALEGCKSLVREEELQAYVDYLTNTDVKTLGTEVGLALYKKWGKIAQQAKFLQKNLKKSSWKPVGRNIGKLI